MDQLGDAAGVVAVGLRPHGRERRLHVPGLDQDRRQPRLDQPRVQPLRQRPRLQADAREVVAAAGQEGGERLRLAGDLRLADDAAGRVEDAYGARRQRHVDPRVVVHGS
jgi:hypothetical protein